MAEPKELFEKKVEEIFWGSNVSGKSGFVNLVQIKQEYFKTWFLWLIDRVENETPDDFKLELYENLTTFVSKYFDKAGNIFFVKTRNNDQITEEVYESNKDVSLFWKTHNLYYVKQDIIHYESIQIIEEIGAVPYTFDFNASEIKDKMANQQKHISYELDDIEATTIKFKLKDSSTKMSNPKIKEIIKKLEEKSIDKLNAQKLQKIFNTFEKQNTVDYFICKDAEKFLTAQFEEFFRNYIFDSKTSFDADRIVRLKLLRKFAIEVIEFVATFEDQLRKVWEKPKFVTDSNFIISFDKIEAKTKGKAVIKKILAAPGFAKQIAEWKDYGTCKKFDVSRFHKAGKINDEFKYLTVDTKHFEELKFDILELFDNLDDELDGWLVNSDNFQALNTLKNKFAGKIKCTYIDPPYNSPKSKVEYINSFEEAPWLTLMENRIKLGKEFLDRKNGVLIAAIDDNEQEPFGLLLRDIYKGYGKQCVTVVHNPKGVAQRKGKKTKLVATHEFAYFIFPPKTNWANETVIPLEKWYWQNLADHGNESERTDAKNCFYPIKVDLSTSSPEPDSYYYQALLGFGDVEPDSFHPKNDLADSNTGNCRRNSDGTFDVWPIDSSGIERKWRWALKSIKELVSDMGSNPPKPIIRIKPNEDDPKNITRIEIDLAKTWRKFKTVWYPYYDEVQTKTVTPYNAGTHGTNLLTKMGFKNVTKENLYPKSLYTVRDCLFTVVADDKKAYVLDYFAGSGTTAHATMVLNKDDDGNRKFILVEQGKYFHDLILPRIKKAALSLNGWNKGQPPATEKRDGIGIFVKYYKLEQYEQVLEKSSIYTKDKPPNWLQPEDYAKYLFMNDPSLIDPSKIKIDFNKNKYSIDYEKIYPNIDLAETLSCVKGEMIKKQEEEKVSFDSEVIDYKEIEFDDVKDLLWWYEV